ncbi:TetR-like C-terminal domain-containing protein [Streptomyces sp. NPDC058464]|uniref:TetR-like C-terminal domain-containing protein n=1 Tax=Streptomyces sp. NPDC058464 TaxID=3346511 RepID=UPI00366556F1
MSTAPGDTAFTRTGAWARVRGEIAAGLDPDLLIDVVHGVLWYRLLLGHAPLDEAAGRQPADLVVRAVR